MNWYLVPLTNTPISFQVNINNVNYTMAVKWNDSPDGGWEFDLSNSDTDTPLAYSIPLICGADCLGGLEYLGIGGKFFVYSQGDSALIPSYETLGSTSNLYFVTP